MSIVDDQIRRLDTALDRIQILTFSSRRQSVQPDELDTQALATGTAPAVNSRLQSLIRSLSASSGSHPLLKRAQLRRLVQELARDRHDEQGEQALRDDTDLAWVAIGKATVQLHGLVLDSLLDQTIPLSESLWYWDEVLGSYANTLLYAVQIGPKLILKSAQETYTIYKEKVRNSQGVREAAQNAQQSIQERWRDFYALVRNSVQERSLARASRRILSPFSMRQLEARKNQTEITRLRETNATAIGLIAVEGLSFHPSQYEREEHSPALHKLQWQSTIAKSVSLLENVVRNATNAEATLGEFEECIFSAVDADPEYVALSSEDESTTEPSKLAKRILHIIDDHLPQQENEYVKTSNEYGKPSRLVRYWIPGVALILSGSTLLRVFANRKAEILQWLQDFGATVQDFWLNWVIEPTRRLIGTIRHDQDSEIAIQSKESLKADKESLERMVVDFAVEHPENGTKYSDAEIDVIRLKVKEGDLTPVLKAYEREMQSPIKNVVMGDLVRTLLIQVQKTKVDVEVAIGGIDSLLKSQELLFGFVGIAPGVLISYFVVQWLRGTFGGRRGIRQKKQQGEAVRTLRNIDRTLTDSTPTDSGIMSYKDYGLLLCEGYVLRRRAAKVIPGSVQREFLEDFNDLMDIRRGIARQSRALARIQWAYSQYLR